MGKCDIFCCHIGSINHTQAKTHGHNSRSVQLFPNVVVVEMIEVFRVCEGTEQEGSPGVEVESVVSLLELLFREGSTCLVEQVLHLERRGRQYIDEKEGKRKEEEEENK